MARFIGEVRGTKGPASRLGDGRKGLIASARGWEVGGVVQCRVNADGEDEVVIYLTSGSNCRRPSKCLGKFTAKDI